MARGYHQLGMALYDSYQQELAAQQQRKTSAGSAISYAWGGGGWGVWGGEGSDSSRRVTRRRARAIAACEEATRLLPANAELHYRLGALLRAIPGRLQEAIQHFNGCLRSEDSHAKALEALREAVGAMQQIGRRTWADVAGNLLSVIMLLAAATHFFVP